MASIAENGDIFHVMESPLKSFCIACARYAAGDRLGELLAVVAAAPYFVIYHVAAIVHARRELHMVFVLLGLLLASALSSGIKKALKQPRPAATCTPLGNCHKHGMPSSHCTVMAFAASICLLLYLHRQRQTSRPQRNTPPSAPPSAPAASVGAAGSARKAPASHGTSSLSRAVRLLEVLGLLALTGAVAYGRIYLGYHTAAQVAAGLALGTCIALAWWRLTLAACQRWSGVLLRLPPLRSLHFRNTLGCADVHAAEASLFDGAAVLHED